MSDVNLYVEFQSKAFIASDGGSPDALAFVLGDKVSIRCDIMDKGSGSLKNANDKFIRSVRASVGPRMTPPSAGSFKLLVGASFGTATATAAIAWNASADDVKAAIGSSAAEVAKPSESCWLVRLSTGKLFMPSNTTSGANTLFPGAFVRVREEDISSDIVWWEVRLITEPYAFSGLFDRELSPPPEMIRIRGGAPEILGTQAGANEVQALTLPNNYAGTYFLRFNYLTTRILGIQDGIDAIASALNALYNDGKVRFQVTNPEDDKAYIEFVGEFAKTAQPLIEAVPYSFFPGGLLFTLDFATASAETALRTAPNGVLSDVPFEIELEVFDSQADLENLEMKGRKITFQTVCALSAELVFDELASAPDIQWLRPPLPKSYQPLSPDQIITGSQYWVGQRGNGTSKVFPIDHGLATDHVSQVTVRENRSGGRMLRDSEYQVTINNADTITITTLASEAYATNALEIVITTAGPRSAFAAHTHNISDITGLQDALDALGGRVTIIEGRLPYTDPTAAADPASAGISIDIDDQQELLPGAFPASDLGGLKLVPPVAPKTRPKILLPALHVSSIGSLNATPQAPGSVTGQVLKNNTGSPITIAGGFGIRSVVVPPNGFAGSDGRVLYAVTHDGTTHSYFPTTMERTLFVLSINDNMLRPGQSLTVTWDIAFKLFNASTNAQYVMVAEYGTAPQDTSPSATGVNLQNVVWNTASRPFAQRIVMTSLGEKGSFGVAVLKKLDGTYNAKTNSYGQWTGTANVPSAQSFLLRLRLVNFDTENSIVNARGTAWYSMTKATAAIQ